MLNNTPIRDTDAYRLDHSWATGFERGQPAWLTTDTAGSGTVTFESDGMTYAQVSTTTASTGTGQLLFDSDIYPNQYDLVVISATVDGPTDPSNVQNRMRLRQSLDSEIEVFRDYDVLSDSGAGDYNIAPIEHQNIRNSDEWSGVEARLFWDVENDRAWCLVGGVASEIMPVTIDPAAGGYTPAFVRFISRNTNTAYTLNCYQLSLELHTRQ